MRDPIFINQLIALSKNRFSLNTLDFEQFYKFYQTLLSNFDVTLNDSWYLIGTDGCRLCDVAESIYYQATLTNSLPKLYTLDLADIKEPDPLMDTLGMMIPIILTPSRLLCYPFNVMDIAHLALSP